MAKIAPIGKKQLEEKVEEAFAELCSRPRSLSLEKVIAHAEGLDEAGVEWIADAFRSNGKTITAAGFDKMKNEYIATRESEPEPEPEPTDEQAEETNPQEETEPADLDQKITPQQQLRLGESELVNTIAIIKTEPEPEIEYAPLAAAVACARQEHNIDTLCTDIENSKARIFIMIDTTKMMKPHAKVLCDFLNTNIKVLSEHGVTRKVTVVLSGKSRETLTENTKMSKLGMLKKLKCAGKAKNDIFSRFISELKDIPSKKASNTVALLIADKNMLNETKKSADEINKAFAKQNPRFSNLAVMAVGADEIPATAWLQYADIIELTDDEIDSIVHNN